jgi:RND family efflux transporter MFP subunit
MPARRRSTTVAVALRATLVLALVAGCSRPVAPPAPVRSVRTVVVEAGTAAGSREYAAEVRARTEARLGFRVGGKLLQRRVDAGQTVRAGELLAVLDPQDLRLAQEAARAGVEAARVSAGQATADLERYRGLRAQGFISEAELQRRETSARAADAQLDQAQAQAGLQRNQTAYTRLTAPADGVVTAVDAEPGAVLSAGTPVLRLALAGPRDVVFAVPETAVGALRALVGRAGGMQVRLWGQISSVPATVREVAGAADPATRTFQIKADLGAALVELGRTAIVTLALPATPGVIRLPLSALREGEGGGSAVWVLDPASMRVQAQAVQVAGADGNVVLVGSGIAPGAEVVTAGVHVLTEGQAVTRWSAPSTPSARAPVPAASVAAAAR